MIPKILKSEIVRRHLSNFLFRHPEYVLDNWEAIRTEKQLSKLMDILLTNDCRSWSIVVIYDDPRASWNHHHDQPGWTNLGQTSNPERGREQVFSLWLKAENASKKSRTFIKKLEKNKQKKEKEQKKKANTEKNINNAHIIKVLSNLDFIRLPLMIPITENKRVSAPNQ